MDSGTLDFVAILVCVLFLLLLLIFAWLSAKLDEVLVYVVQTHAILQRLAPFLGILGTTEEARSQMDQASEAYLNELRKQTERKQGGQQNEPQQEG